MAVMTKAGFFAGILLLFSTAGWKFYRYVGTTSMPVCTLSGIEPEGTYAQSRDLTIKGSDEYKVSSLALALDGKPLAQVKIGRKSFEKPFSLTLDSLSEGAHTFTATVEGAGYKSRKTTTTCLFYVDRTPLSVAFIKNGVDAKVYQGKTLHIQFQANKELAQAQATLFSKTYPCFLESNRSFIYECYIPVECEERPHEYALVVEALDRAGNKATLEASVKILPFSFKKQILNIPREKIKAEREQGLSEKELEKELERLEKSSPSKKLWNGPFITPVEIKDIKQITTEYGVIRATQERGLCQHKALDLYATPKSVVWAPQDGIVVLKSRFAHSGNTIVLDHGYGVLTLLFHLDTFAPLEVGDLVKKGKPVGTVGMTGFATGYHVHWEMHVRGTPVDPLEWTLPHF